MPTPAMVLQEAYKAGQAERALKDYRNAALDLITTNDRVLALQRVLRSTRTDQFQLIEAAQRYSTARRIYHELVASLIPRQRSAP